MIEFLNYWGDSGLIKILELVFSILLTISLIAITSIIAYKQSKMTKVLNNERLEFEKKNNLQFMEIQRKQLRIDSLKYKREVYKQLFSVMILSIGIDNLIKRRGQEVVIPEHGFSSIGKLDDELLLKLIKSNYDKTIKDYTEIYFILREAEFLFSPEINEYIKVINVNFDQLTTKVMIIEKLELILTEEEMKDKSNVINAIKKNCMEINEQIETVENYMMKELRIFD